LHPTLHSFRTIPFDRIQKSSPPFSPFSFFFFLAMLFRTESSRREWRPCLAPPLSFPLFFSFPLRHSFPLPPVVSSKVPFPQQKTILSSYSPFSPPFFLFFLSPLFFPPIPLGSILKVHARQVQRQRRRPFLPPFFFPLRTFSFLSIAFLRRAFKGEEGCPSLLFFSSDSSPPSPFSCSTK